MSPQSIQIRPATPADVDPILALERAAATAPHWPRTAYQSMLEPSSTQQRCLLVAELAGEILGFAVAMLPPTSSPNDQPTDQPVAELESVVVAESARRSGIGRALCSAILARCFNHNAAAVILEVRAHSTAAIALYAALGFAPFGLRPRYYADPPDDALLMRRPADIGPV